MDTIGVISFWLGIVSVMLGLVSVLGVWLGVKQGRLVSEIAQLSATLQSNQVAAAELEVLEKLGVLRQHSVNINDGDLSRLEHACGDVCAVLSLIEFTSDELRHEVMEAIVGVLDALEASENELANTRAARLRNILSTGGADHSLHGRMEDSPVHDVAPAISLPLAVTEAVPTSE